MFVYLSYFFIFYLSLLFNYLIRFYSFIYSFILFPLLFLFVCLSVYFYVLFDVYICYLYCLIRFYLLASLVFIHLCIYLIFFTFYLRQAEIPQKTSKTKCFIRCLLLKYRLMFSLVFLYLIHLKARQILSRLVKISACISK